MGEENHFTQNNSGTFEASKGEVYIAGKRVEELGKWRSKIGYVPQTAQIDYTFPITVEEFVMTGRFGLIGLGKRPQAHDWEMVRKALREVKMEEWSKNKLENYLEDRDKKF